MTLLLTYLLPLLLPTAVYMLWRLWRARAARPVGDGPVGESPMGEGSTGAGVDGGGMASPGQEIDWRDAPWLLLALAGVVLLVAVLLIGVLDHPSGPPGRYVPPRLEDGRIVPGELRQETPGANRSGAEGSNDRSGSSAP